MQNNRRRTTFLESAKNKDGGVMAEFYAAGEGDPKVLGSKTVAVIGYGNQGRAQAINLRRAGHKLHMPGRNLYEALLRAPLIA